MTREFPMTAPVAHPGDVLKTPWPWPGGKGRVADLVWGRLGNVKNYVEPFAGSLAALMRRPADHFADGYRVETVNDLNSYVVNFWRAVAGNPKEVARWADNPVTEADLHARHKWLVRSKEARAWRARIVRDPFYYDTRIAGWWAWGQCSWIGGAWCAHKVDQSVMPLLDGSQKGVNSNLAGDSADSAKMPRMTGGRKGDEYYPGIGVNNIADGDAAGGRPQMADAFDIGRGVNSGGNLSTQIPDLGSRGVNAVGDYADKTSRPMLASGPGDGGRGPGACGVIANMQVGTCEGRRAWLTAWMRRLADRLRLVRTCYGHWSRICDSESTTTRLGLTGAFLDPPYPTKRGDDGQKSRNDKVYATDAGADLCGLRDEVLAWCRKYGPDPMMRVAVCGYEGDGYESLLAEGWTQEAWEAGGGYANQGRKGKGKSENAKRERIWFSPNCLKAATRQPVAADLFAGVEP